MPIQSIRIRSPRQAIRAGIGFSPEDRKAGGVVGDLSVRDNIFMGREFDGMRLSVAAAGAPLPGRHRSSGMPRGHRR
mgnify:CR=1 FL=1